MSDVFISYSRKDNEFVRKLYQAFKDRGKEVWVDFEDIPLTADWWQEIQAGIDAAETFIFVLTPDSVRSDICRQEIDHAVSTNKRLVPILHREIIDDADKTKLHEHISAHNWIFFREADDFESAFKNLVESVETDLDHNRTHTRLLVRAKEWDDSIRNKAYLLRDQDLHQAEGWLTQGLSKNPTPTNLHAEYIASSRQAQSSRQRSALLGVTVALGVAIALTIFSIFQWRDAQIARDLADQAKDQAELAREEAERSAILARSLAMAAYTQDALSDEKPDLALALALEAVKVDPNQPQVLRALRDAAYSPGTRLLLDNHSEFVWDVDFDERGGLIVSGSADDNVCIWTTQTGEPLACMGADGETSHDSDVIAVEFLADAMRAVSADDTGVIKMWNTNPRAPQFRKVVIQRTFIQPIKSFKLHPDEQSALVGLTSGLIYRWYFETDTLERFERVHLAQVNAIDISDDGQYAISGGDDDQVVLWDMETGTALGVLNGHTNNVLSVAFSDDGLQALSGGQDNTFILWDVPNRAEIFELEGHESGVSDVAFGPTPNHITTASWDNSIRVWDTYTHRRLREFKGHTGGVNRIDLSADGHFMVSASYDTNIRVWETDSFIDLNFIEGDGSVIQHMAYSADGDTFASAHDSHDVIIWDSKSTERLTTLTGNTDRAVSVAFSPDSQLVASVSADNRLMVWDWQSGEVVLNLPDVSDRVYMVLFSTSNSEVYVGLRSSIRWWDINTGEQLGDIPYGGIIGGINSLAISPDGKYLLAGLRGSTDNLNLIDMETGEIVHELEGHTDGILSTAITADGKIGISGSWDNSARVWDLETGEAIHTLIAHTERVSAVDISPDGRHAITGSNDRSMRLWDLERGAEELEYNGHTDRVQVVAFHPSGREMLTGSIDTTALVWRLPHPLDELLGWIERNRYVAELNCTERDVYQIEPYCTDEE